MKFKDQLEAAALDIKTPLPGMALIDTALAYWPLIRVACTIVMIFTGKRADAKIRKGMKAWDDLYASRQIGS